MKRITTRAELVALARELGVRPDWHAPDEHELGAFVEGESFDNAGTWPTSAVPHLQGTGAIELHVILHRTHWDEQYGTARRGSAVAAVNLATLLAWATGYDERASRSELDSLDDLEREQNDAINRVVRNYFTMSDPQDCQLANAIIGELKEQLPRARPVDYEHPHERPCGWEEQVHGMRRQLRGVARQIDAAIADPWRGE